MNAQLLFNQGKPSNQVKTILEHLESADLGSPDIEEDDVYQSWGHYQFTAGGISLSSSLTSWQSIGNVPTVFKLVEATLKTCHKAQLMCADTRMTEKGGYINDIYLEQILEYLEKCWVSAGRVHSLFISCLNLLHFFRRFLPMPWPI